MSQREISNYISQLSEKGISSLEDICNEAKKEIEDIKEYLHIADTKRIRMTLLASVISQFGVNESRKKIHNVSYDENDEEIKVLHQKIIELIADKPMTNREIIQAIGKYQEDHKVFRAIKFLGENNVIKRDDSSERRIIKGDGWDEYCSK